MKKRKFALVLMIGLFVAAMPSVRAGAAVDLPADDGDALLPVGIDGEFAVGGVANLVAISSTADASTSVNHQSCSGCHALHHMYWTNYGLYEYVGVKEVHAISRFAVDRIAAHTALLHGTGRCYEGNYYWQGTFDRTNTTGWTKEKTPKFGTGYNDTYTLAGGRTWYNGGMTFRLAGGQDAIDICKKF